MTAKKQSEPSAEELAARELVRLAKEQGLSLTGPEGLLKQFTKNVLETALNEEMTEHLGHEKNRAAEGRDSTNVRNSTRSKTVLTHGTGQVDLEVPRDRDGTFKPVIVRKRRRRLVEVDEIVLWLDARDLMPPLAPVRRCRVSMLRVTHEREHCGGARHAARHGSWYRRFLCDPARKLLAGGSGEVECCEASRVRRVVVARPCDVRGSQIDVGRGACAPR